MSCNREMHGDILIDLVHVDDVSHLWGVIIFLQLTHISVYIKKLKTWLTWLVICLGVNVMSPFLLFSIFLLLLVLV